MTALRTDGQLVVLSQDGDVFMGDVLSTDAGAAVGIVFLDESSFSLAENGRMVLDEMIYDPVTAQGSSSFSILEGVFVFVSGEIAANNPDGMVVETPVTTLGIRGTKVAGKAAAEGEENRISLLEQEDGYVGEIVVWNGGGQQVLNSAGATTSVWSWNQSPTAPTTMSTAELEQAFGSAMSALPPPENRSMSNDGSRRSDGGDEAAQAAAEAEAEAEAEGEGEGEGEGGVDEHPRRGGQCRLGRSVRLRPHCRLCA